MTDVNDVPTNLNAKVFLVPGLESAGLASQNIVLPVFTAFCPTQAIATWDHSAELIYFTAWGRMSDLSGQCRAASGVAQRPEETSWPPDGMPSPWSGWWCCPSGHSACHPSLMVMKVCSILAMVWGVSPELGGLRRLPGKTTRAGSRPYNYIFALFPTSMLFQIGIWNLLSPLPTLAWELWSFPTLIFFPLLVR